MTDPQRFLEDETSDIEADLMRSALSDAPTHEARQRAALALGLIDPGGGPSGGSPPAPPLGGRALLGKWIAGLAALGGAALLLGLLSSSSSQPPIVAVPSGAPAEAAAAPSSEPVAARETPEIPAQPVEPPTVPPERVDESPSARKQVPAPVARAAPSAPAPEVPSLAAEVASLDRARSALRSGGAAAALRELDRHQREFPRGALSMEAMVLRIEAQSRGGNRSAAVALARAFLRASPRSPYAARVRSLVPEAGDE